MIFEYKFGFTNPTNNMDNNNNTNNTNKMFGTNFQENLHVII